MNTVIWSIVGMQRLYGTSLIPTKETVFISDPNYL